jgi:hypothetical protein
MNRRDRTVESLVREGFSLLLDLRAQPDASRLLSLAGAFLDMLRRQKDTEETPMVISIQAVRIRKR